LTKQYPIDLFEGAKDHADVVAPPLRKPANFRRKSNLMSVAVLAVIIPGLFATVALPAYGAGNSSLSAAAKSNARLEHALHTDPQTVFVSASASVGPSLDRDTITYTAPPPPPPPPKPVVVVHHSFTGLVQSYGNISITGVAAIAAKYIGVPYVFGGESPAGFDCSGLVAYVYNQVGIHLPHSSMEQGHMGTRVSVADAQPGDVVVFNGGTHVGLYIGAGHMIDAPYPGRVVSIDAIYSNDYWIVHY